MSIDGIWKVEMLGPYGWEAMSTAFLHKGRYWGGSTEYYNVGRYTIDGKKVTAKTLMVIHGKLSALFGKQAKQYKVQFEGKISNETIEGKAKDDEGMFLVRFRATKLGDLPKQ